MNPYALLSLLPAAAFLAALTIVDTYQLVPTRRVFLLVFGGVFAAAAALGMNNLLLGSLSLDPVFMTRYAAPALEELLKALLPTWFILRDRIGFPGEAALVGLSVGVGFALAENGLFLVEHPQAGVYVFVSRGLGTAMMHGGSTSIFTMLTLHFYLRHERFRLWMILPGWLLAAGLHSGFNHFFFSPMAEAAMEVVAVSLLMGLVFFLSERELRRWLDQGFDSDVMLLEALQARKLPDSRAGRYLKQLDRQVSGELKRQVLEYLHLHLELAVRAKGRLMLTEVGFAPPPDRKAREELAELERRSRELGRMGRMAVAPVLRNSRREVWQMVYLSEAT